MQLCAVRLPLMYKPDYGTMVNAYIGILTYKAKRCKTSESIPNQAHRNSVMISNMVVYQKNLLERGSKFKCKWFSFAAETESVLPSISLLFMPSNAALASA
jgi:hypothetical protein